MGKKNKRQKPGTGTEAQVTLTTRSTGKVTDPSVRSKTNLWLGIIVTVFAFVLYAQTISFEYAYDDDAVIADNKLVKQGLSGIPDLATSDYWYGITNEKEGAVYRPASLVMFAIEWHFFPDNPQVSHFINVLLYSITCFLIFLLLAQLFQNQNPAIPFICALLYVAHPIHTEVVSNIKSRDEILCFLFALIATLSFLKYYTKNKVWFLIPGSIFFFLSLLSKETGITFVAAIPLILFVFRETNFKRLAISAGSLAAIAAVFMLLRQQMNIHMPDGDKISLLDNVMAHAENFTERIATALFVLLKYLGLLIFPHPLSADYSYSQIELQSFGNAPVILAFIIFSAAALFSIYAIRKKNILAFAILFFLITVSPVANIFLLIGSSMGERFMFIPSLGFCILLTGLLLKVSKLGFGKKDFTPVRQFFAKNTALSFFALTILVAYSVKTIARSSYWKNNVALFGKDIKTSDKSARTHYNYGIALLDELKDNPPAPAQQQEIITQAGNEFATAISILPEYGDAYLGMGVFYKDRIDYKNAIYNFEKAKQFYKKPKPIVFQNLGYVYLKDNQFEKAVNALDSFLVFEPPTAEILNNKGSALFGLQRYADALEVYQKAKAMNPSDVLIYKNIGRCYIYLQQYDMAPEYFSKCIELDPGDSENYKFLGMTYNLLNDTARGNPLLRRSELMSQMPR